MIIATYPVMFGIVWVFKRVVKRNWFAVLLWCVSLGIGIWLLATGRLDFAAAVAQTGTTVHPPGIAYLAPVCLFGFALCPYLDLTFLRAAGEQRPADARASFTIGFGAMFFAMILLTLGYATAFIPIANGVSDSGPVPLVVSLILLHMLLQLAYTTYVHIARVVSVLGTKCVRARIALLACTLVLAGLVWGIAYHALPRHAGLTPGEIIYRCFMSFYGLVFPAYVWLCMIPTGDGHSGTHGERGRRKLVVWAAACVLAAPCYWMGFIERVEWWLGVGLGVVLLARLLVRSSAPIPSPASAGEGGRGPARTGEGASRV